MADAREYQSDFEAAEAAATQGDFVRAESLLRSGLARQEAALGGAHPEVASTLNNLAVVCETLGRIDDAERFYRRAHAVAAATRPDDDPLVTTSLANLRDFCRAHGRRAEDTAPPTAAFEPVRASNAVATALPTPPVTRQSARPARATANVAAPPAATPGAATAPAPAAIVPRGFAAALFLVATLATAAVSWLWLRPTAPPNSAPAPVADPAPAAAAPPSSSPAPASAPVAAVPPATEAPAPSQPPVATATPAAPARPTASSAAEPAPAEATPRPAPPSAAATPPPASARPAVNDAGTAASVRVIRSELCAPLETRGRTWRCTPVDDAAAPGRVSFVTRVASPRPVRLQHRWSRNGAVRQTVSLSVAASPSEGYRTFSRQTVTPGSWTVALVDASGAVLREVSFDVR